MAIFWRLVLGHFVADFTFQTNWLAAIKRQASWGMLLHSLIHPLAFIVLTHPFLEDVWVRTRWFSMSGWACIVFLFATHYLQDKWRVYTIQHFHTADSTLHLAWDQLVHFAAIFVVFPWTEVGNRDWAFWFPERWVLIALLVAMVTHFTTVLIYYVEKDLWGGKYPTDDEKYLTMAERLVLLLCALLPGVWWPAVSAAWLAAGVYVRKRRLLEYPWFGFCFGGALSLAAGFGVHFLLA